MDILFVITWFLLAAAVAGLASSRGRSAIGYFLLSVITSPLIGLIVVLVTRNLAKEAADEEVRLRREQNEAFDRKRDHERQLEALRAVAPSKPVVSVAEELEKLVKLRDSNVLTPAEFEQQKRALLQRSP